MTRKERLDVLLVQNGFFASREKARSSIMAGLVFVDGKMVDKAGAKVNVDASLSVKGVEIPYVSRGGLKLAKAIKVFALKVAGLTAMDVGASTGGFTDCLLQHGAAKVYAVDVGYGQLAWSLRQDPRVVVLERTNIRYLTPTQIPDPIHLVTVDVSFISLTKISGQLKQFMANDGEIVALIKPQFEAGPEKVGKHGVVRDPAVHQEVIAAVIADFVARGFTVKGLDYSPIKGPQGNIEYLLHATLKTAEKETAISPAKIVTVVKDAHQALN